MSLCKTGQIQNCCHPNALMTLCEYLVDYASEDTKKIGFELIEKELNKIPNAKAQQIARENVDAFYLEYDDERSGGFEPLAHVAPGKKVVLGLITTKSAILEDKQTIIARIHEAAQYIPLDRLYLSPQCGFASCEIGNKLTEEEQWAKIKLVKEIAKEVWE